MTGQTYQDELLLALRMRDVPGPQIAEALAEVHSHVAETGEDPHEAFGPPRAYAGEVVAALGRTRPPGVRTSTIAGYGLGGAAGAWLLLEGALALAEGRGRVLGLPPLVPLLLGVAVLVALAVGLRRLAHDPDVPVLDPRTGADLVPPLPRWVLPAMIAPAVLTLGLAVVLVLAAR